MLGLDKSVVTPITDTVNKLAKTAENLATDRRTILHQIDTTSKFMLPHLIRPLSFLITLGNEVILGWASIFITGGIDDNAALIAAIASNTGILGTQVAYYYKSRKEEKITAKTAQANIMLKEMELSHELKMKEAEFKEVSRKERRATRKNKN
mgnify:CR=1 FL=1|tara:strand:- start:314 stop:769 length:456 start_codon:yes stop_codon:yes gene_type:complete